MTTSLGQLASPSGISGPAARDFFPGGLKTSSGGAPAQFRPFSASRRPACANPRRFASLCHLVSATTTITQPETKQAKDMPGTLAPPDQRPMSAIGKVKSEKALRVAAALNGGGGAGGVGAPVGEPYLRGAKGALEDMDRLAKLDWTQELLAQPGMQTLLTCGAMSKPPVPGEVNGVDPDHLFLSLLRQDLIRDLLFLWNPLERTFHTLLSLGVDVCGHPSIVHGGFTSAMIDETTGGLVYELKKLGELGEGSAFTARLEVDYKKPIPATSDVVCTARVEKVDGRKIWTVAEVADRPGGTVYAVGKALYVTPRSQAGGDGAVQPQAAA